MVHTFTTFAGRNLNLSELARENGLRRAHLHHIFNFRRTPSLFYAIRLSRALGMSLDEFVAALARRRFELEGKDSDESQASSRQLAPAHKEAVLASSDETIHLWDPVRGQPTRTAPGGQDTLTSVAWSPDGRMLASTGNDKTIRLWEVASGRLVHTLRGHRSIVRTVAWSPDGRILASAGLDGSIRLWEVPSGTLIHTLRGNRNLLGFASNRNGEPVLQYRGPGPGT